MCTVAFPLRTTKTSSTSTSVLTLGEISHRPMSAPATPSTRRGPTRAKPETVD